MAQINFEGLRELHDCVNYLLDHCPKTRESLSQQGQEKCTEQVSEASLRMLDICNVSKDVMTLVKHSLQDLQLTLRGSESSDVNEKIAAYNRYKNKLKKETLKCLNCLKNMKGSEGRVAMPIEQNLLFVAEVLKEVRRVVVTMVESLFSLGCIPWLEKRSSKGSLSSIFTIRSSYLLDDVWDETAVQSATTRLEAAEIAVEELEIELESIFRRLIQTRVSLLNILTN
ncbi:unnamed protein product [Arabidopsis lyrata]|uniref:DUF241 domain-containing protein n=2 Tax=Arabidopsis TaxID=3701 RepID=D7KTB0_ARALL|nr:uncharacterized protein LOC9323695 [Arabidopsis lyrata subsp. lyrata]EFH65325.1 hypothetical protein ARALYDRAFT_895499 [Arabidopsis lyrata subsp. lyrata]KAG7587228.1 hypothetical protein ISN45_Aa02g024510 [Arabidopsis thaliana x Arabidopsis arenosa]CAH8258330.1 unnamed protein product [Arabidopsis lyrata]|eukprot:XP_002889066.1 uncharacterized protein LOC9323695 [Arabidopsis lyrata subsp. lyrata]